MKFDSGYNNIPPTRNIMYRREENIKELQTNQITSPPKQSKYTIKLQDNKNPK